MALHIAYEFTADMIPRECIQDCSHAGDCADDVDHWLSKLELTVDRGKAIAYLEGYGAWEDADLAAMSDDDIARKILWLACCTFREGDDLLVLE